MIVELLARDIAVAIGVMSCFTFLTSVVGAEHMGEVA